LEEAAEQRQRIFLIFPLTQTCGAGISTLHSAGFSGTGCYGVIGPDPSAVLDKFKQLSLLRHLPKNIKRFLINSNLIIYTTMWHKRIEIIIGIKG
jgi:hypothetical protein